MDLHKDQLCALTPDSHYSMIINNEGIEQVNLHNTTFIYFRPTKKTDLNKGFYELLQDGKRKYYLEYNGIYYPVSNNKSFAKIFPEQHKLIKRYARKHKLNFRHDADASLIALTNFCEELIDQKQTR